MMNRLMKKIAYILCMSSLMYLTTVESMPKEDRNDNNNNNSTQIVKDVQNIYNIQSGLLGVKRNIYVKLMAMSLDSSRRNMGGVSSTVCQWINNESYAFCINSEKCRDIRLKRLRQSIEGKWWNEISSTDDVRMLYNGKTIVIANNNGIFYSIDGITTNIAFDKYSDIIVADGKYVAAVDNKLFTSDNCVSWETCQCNSSFYKIAYDEVKKIYYGVTQDGVYICRNIAELAACRGSNANAINNFNGIYDNIFCGNDIAIAKINNFYYVRKNNSLKPITLSDPIIDMFYDKKSKSMIALTNDYYLEKYCNGEKVEHSWAIYSSKDIEYWKNDFFISKYNLATNYLNGYQKPIFATISGYPIMITQCSDQGRASVFVQTGKKDAPLWEKISDIIIDTGDEIKQLIDTRYGTFVIIKKAVGNMTDNEPRDEYEQNNEDEDEDEYDSRFSSLFFGM